MLPNRSNAFTQIAELSVVDNGFFFAQRSAMSRGPISQIGFPQQASILSRHNVQCGQCFQQAHIIGEAGEFTVGGGPSQNPVSVSYTHLTLPTSDLV